MPSLRMLLVLTVLFIFNAVLSVWTVVDIYSVVVKDFSQNNTDLIRAAMVKQEMNRAVRDGRAAAATMTSKGNFNWVDEQFQKSRSELKSRFYSKVVQTFKESPPKVVFVGLQVLGYLLILRGCFSRRGNVSSSYSSKIFPSASLSSPIMTTTTSKSSRKSKTTKTKSPNRKKTRSTDTLETV